MVLKVTAILTTVNDCLYPLAINHTNGFEFSSSIYGETKNRICDCYCNIGFVSNSCAYSSLQFPTLTYFKVKHPMEYFISNCYKIRMLEINILGIAMSK